MEIIVIVLLLAINMIKLGQGYSFDANNVFIAKNKFSIIKGIIVSVFLVPVLFAFLILIFQPPHSISSVLIIISVCPAAYLSIQQVEKLGGDVAFASVIQVISSIICIATIPLFLFLFNYFFGSRVNIPFLDIIRDVAIAQFIPMSIGLALRKFLPNHAWIAKFLIKAGTILLVLCFAFLLIKNHHVFYDFKIRAYLMIGFATACAFMLGLLFSDKSIKQKISLAIESSLRSPGLAYLIAVDNFSLDRVNQAMLPYIVTTIFVVVFCTFIFKQFHKSLN